MISWNVNGIRAVIKKGALHDFLDKHDPDILCLQETKAHKEQVEIDLPQYHEYWNSAEKKGYSGTAIFSKTEPLNVFNDFLPAVAKKYDFIDDQDRDVATEGRVITAEFESYFVVNQYRPNAKDDLSRLNFIHRTWNPAFKDHCAKLAKKKPVILCGDLNVAHQEIDLARPKPNKGKKGFTDQEREGMDNLLAAGFLDTLRVFEPETPELYTWWSYFGKARERNVGWRIDYVCVSESFKKNLTKAFILPEVMGSDHCPVGIEFKA